VPVQVPVRAWGQELMLSAGVGDSSEDYLEVSQELAQMVPGFNGVPMSLSSLMLPPGFGGPFMPA